jgi:predicted O-methyltransferase YrrM
MQDLWARVDRYFDDLLAPADAALQHALEANHAAGLPGIDVPASLGKFLALLVQMSGAKRVLEIGTLGGYSTIWLARAVPEGGRVVTLELEQRHAEIALSNLEFAGAMDRVEIRVGPALETLRAMTESGEEPFGLIFIDADKKSMPEYVEYSLRLSRPGTVLVLDNVVRDGQVLDANTDDENVQGVQRCMEMLAREPRLSATAIPTVGARGYDGFAVAVVQK